MNPVCSDLLRFRAGEAGGTNINSPKDAYMRSLTITFIDKNRIVEKWMLFKDGKEKGTTVFELTRVKE